MAGLTRRFDGGRFAASRFNGQRKGDRAPVIITADSAPQLAAANDADTPADVFTAGAYSSTAGTISDVITTYLVNGSAEASSYDLAAGDTLQVTELVTDSAGNSRTFSTDVVTVTVSDDTPVAEPVVMSMGGITATYDSATASGTYANGEPWVSSGGASGAFTAQSPAGATATRTLSGGKQINSVPSNGAQLDPGRAASGATLADRQAVNDGETLTLQGYDGLDDVVATDGTAVGVNNLAYDAALNVADDYPLSLAEGSLVVAQSALRGISDTVRPAIEGLSVFTVAPSAPAAGDFRPGVADPSKTPMLNTADFDLTKLRDLDSTGYSIPDAATVLGQLRFETWQHTYNVLSRNIVPGEPIYGGDRYTWTEAMVWVHFDAWTATEKRDICHAIAQHAIDLTARAEQGGIWQENGGHCAGPMAIVAFTAWLTGNARMLAALGFTTTLFSHDGAPHSIWGAEGRQFFYISQADIDRVKDFPFTQDQLGLPEWSSDATRDDPVARRNERQNSLGVDTPDGVPQGEEDYKQTYRHIIARVNVPTALAATIGGWRELLPPAMLDYQDRHMNARIAAGAALPQGGANDMSADIVAAWQAHRVTKSINVASTGQSELDYTSLSDYGTTLPVDTLTHPGQFRVRGRDGTGNASGTVEATTRDVLLDNSNAGTVNRAWPVVANAFHHILPDWSVIHSEADEAGTGRIDLAQDSDDATERDWSDTAEIFNETIAQYGDVDLLLEYWYAADQGRLYDFNTFFSPFYRRQYVDGSPFTLGSTIPGGTQTIDHALFDHNTVDPRDKGQGLLPRTVEHFIHYKAPWGTDATNDGSQGLDARFRGVQEFVDDARFTGFYGGGQEHYSYGGHADQTDPDGLFAAGLNYRMLPLLRAAWRKGADIPEPKQGRWSAVTFASDNTYADVTFDAPMGVEVLGTRRAILSETAPSSDRYQPVAGFEIKRTGGGGRYMIVPSTSTGYAEEYRGSVVRQDDTTVRITPDVPFAEGDEITFCTGPAYWRGDYNTDDWRKDPDKLWKDLPVSHIPAWTDTDALYPFVGWPILPIRPTDPFVAPALVGTPSEPRFDLNTAQFSDTANVPAATSVIEFEAKFVLNSTVANFDEIFAAVSDMRIELAFTENLVIRATRIEDSTGADLMNGTAPFLGSMPYSLGDVVTINVKVDFVADEITLTRDGTLVGVTPFVLASNGEATKTRKLNLFSYNGASTMPANTSIEYVRVKLNDVLHKEISIDAQGSIAGINADPWHSGGDVTASA